MTSISAASLPLIARLTWRERLSARHEHPFRAHSHSSRARVGEWVYSQDEESLYLSAVSIGELRRGFVILPKGKRRTKLELWFEKDLMLRFRGRILPVTYSQPRRWSTI